MKRGELLTNTHAYLNLLSNGKYYSYSYHYAGNKSFQSLHKIKQTVVNNQAHNLQSAWQWITGLIITGTSVIDDDNYQFRATPALFNCSNPANCSLIELSTGDYFRNSSRANLSSIECVIAQTDDFRFMHYGTIDSGISKTRNNLYQKEKPMTSIVNAEVDDEACLTRGCDVLATSKGKTPPIMFNHQVSSTEVYSSNYAYHLIFQTHDDSEYFTLYHYDPSHPTSQPASITYKKDSLIRPFGISSHGTDIYFVYNGSGSICMSSTPLLKERS